MTAPSKLLTRVREIDWIMSKSIPLVIFFFGGSIQVLIAKISPLLKNSDPIIYSGIFFAGAFLSILAYHLLIQTQTKKITANFAKRLSSVSSANPLESKFEKQTINIESFFSPFYIPHRKKIFQDCHIIGTGSIFMSGCTLSEITFTGGQIILVDNKARIINVTSFDHCHFIGGRFINCTLMMPTEMYTSLPEKFKQSIPVISVSKPASQ